MEAEYYGRFECKRIWGSFPGLQQIFKKGANIERVMHIYLKSIISTYKKGNLLLTDTK